MNKTLTALASVLCLQLIIAAALYFSESSVDYQENQQSLLAVESTAVNKLVIAQTDNNITLSKEGDNWQLTSAKHLPINQSKVNTLLDNLVDIKTAWPTTTSSTSHERFKVANDNFEKQVSFYQGDKLQQQLIIGTSPSFKKVYVRDSERDEVYTVDFNSYEFPIEHADWLDKSALAVKDITSFSTAKNTLNKEGENWLLMPPSVMAEDKEIDNEKLNTISLALGKLTVTDLSNTTPSKLTKLTVKNQQDETFIFSFAKEEDKYFIKRNDISQWFVMSEQSYQHLLDVNLQSLLIDKVNSDKSTKALDDTLDNILPSIPSTP